MGRFSSLALDAAGNPHISYYENWNIFGVGGNLKYAEWNGSSWNIQTVDNGDGKRFVGMYSSLALDAAGNPHISYYDEGKVDGSGCNLRYAKWNGTSWNIEIVDNGGGKQHVGMYTSLALDAAGNPHISYYEDYYYDHWKHEGSGASLRYAAWNGTSWNLQIVDNGAVDNGGGKRDVLGMYSSLALDAAGNPHISYYENWNIFGVGGNLKYAEWNGTSWNIQTVDDGGGWQYVGMESSLALDAAGNPHISYHKAGDSNGYGYTLRYAEWNGTSWNIEIVDNGGEEGRYVGRYSSIALDAAGNPHISYYQGGRDDHEGGHLKYAEYRY